MCVICDVTKEDDVKNAVAKCVERFGRIDVAIANAGINPPTPLIRKNAGLNIKVFERALAINLYGCVYLAKYAATAMSKNNPSAGNSVPEKGVIIFVSSIAAEEAGRTQAAYGASKGALNGLTLPMARDLGRYGIRVVSIAPGIFDTPLGDEMPDKLMQGLVSFTPMGRAGIPDEFAHLACTVIENEYINGVRLRIDGAIKLGYL